MVKAKIDALAAALGSVHGTYSGEPVLGFDEMLAISRSYRRSISITRWIRYPRIPNQKTNRTWTC